jgi:hypothetical protein
MADENIELDLGAAKPKPQVPVWMLVIAIISFGCFTATLVLQILERGYMRGQSSSETDAFASQVLIPPAP